MENIVFCNNKYFEVWLQKIHLNNEPKNLLKTGRKMLQNDLVIYISD